MNKKVQKGVITVVLSSMILTNTAFAASNVINKSETVYVLKKDDDIKDKTVSVWLNSEEDIKGKDKSNLKNIKRERIEIKISVINFSIPILSPQDLHLPPNKIYEKTGITS